MVKVYPQWSRKLSGHLVIIFENLEVGFSGRRSWCERLPRLFPIGSRREKDTARMRLRARGCDGERPRWVSRATSRSQSSLLAGDRRKSSEDRKGRDERVRAEDRVRENKRGENE